MTASKLERIIAVSLGLTAFATPLFFRPANPHTTAERALKRTTAAIIDSPHITPYIGNYPDSFVVSAVSGLIGDYISSVGKTKNSRCLTFLGKYLPEIITCFTSTYFTLGETILPQILPGMADPRDVPLSVLGSVTGYCIAQISRKSGFNEYLRSLVKHG